jgi:hypothetical protein
VRPIRGTRALELAFGGRITPIQGFEPRYWVPVFAPRGRIEAGGRGVRVFAEGEQYLTRGAAFRTRSEADLRVMAGLELDFSPTSALALAPSLGAGPGAACGAAGLRGQAAALGGALHEPRGSHG